MKLGITLRSIYTVRNLMILDFIILAIIILLEVRDLWVRMLWMGPTPTHSFQYSSDYTIIPTPLQPTANFSYIGQKLIRKSGWTSFYDKCDQLYPLTNEGQVTMLVLAKNCSIVVDNMQMTIPEVIAVGNIPAHDIAWASCSLLHFHRKPAICYLPFVQNLGFHFRLTKAELDSLLVTPGSDVEEEIIQLLLLLSKSSPLSKVVCLEAYFRKNATQYSEKLYGCGSPNIYQSTFVGFSSTAVSALLKRKGNLAVENINVYGVEYLIQTSSQSAFTVSGSVDNGTLQLHHTSHTLYEMHGTLYYLAILIDIYLLFIFVQSTIQIVDSMLLPNWDFIWKGETSSTTYLSCKHRFQPEDFIGIVYVSQYRSWKVGSLILISRLVSWITIVPLTQVVKQADSKWDQLHAILSIVRFLLLTLIVFNFLWSCFVKCFEIKAFLFTKATYIAEWEVFIISAIVAICHQGSLLSIRQTEHSRNYLQFFDNESFEDNQIVAAYYRKENLGALSTFDTLYSPLVTIIIHSNLSTLAFAILRLMYTWWRYPTLCSSESGTNNLIKPQNIGNPIPHRISRQSAREYKRFRLPVERLLNIPVRAKSVVRSNRFCETSLGQKLVLKPRCLLENGIVLDGTRLETRSGWDSVLPCIIFSNTEA